jgi:hypothetical protein
MKIKLFFICQLLFLHLGAQDAITVNFSPKMLNEELVLSKEYNLNKSTVNISHLKFYISDMTFYYGDSLVFVLKKKYHLFDLSQPSTASLTEKLGLPIKYNQVKFNIGIDSLTNVSGAIEGDLDPTNGMYWTWQSGYINFKLEGKSPICPTRLNKFQWHIGGYMTPYNTIKEVSLSTQYSKKVVNIDVQIDELLQSFDLSQTYQIMSPNDRAVQIANRLPTIFKLSKNEK